MRVTGLLGRKEFAFWRSAKIIISIVFVLVLSALFKNQSPYPEIIFSNDFYGYIELGKNIFNGNNFLVRWSLDNLIKYPPLFSILIYILTYFTKDPLVSIQFLNAFSAGLCVVPLYLVTKKLFNRLSAFLAVAFMVYFLGLRKPCFNPYLDYFFTFLTITVFWFLWEILSNENAKPRHFVLAGMLISITYLTKYHGMIYAVLAVILIFSFFKHKKYRLNAILKRISFLFLGLLPLVILYHFILFINSRHQQVSNSMNVLFFDGINRLDNKNKILNPEGNEFKLVSDYQRFTVASFCIKNPHLVLNNFVDNLKIAFKYMTKMVFPFAFAKKGNFYLIIQYILAVLVLIALTYYKRRLNIIYILSFASVVLFIPWFVIILRYLMPFVPFYFLLWLAGMNTLFNLVKGKISKEIAKFFAFILSTVLIFSYSSKFYKVIRSPGQDNPYKEYFAAAEWINSNKTKSKRPKIMSFKATLPYLTDSKYILLPYEESWERIIRFALAKNTDYIVLDKKSLLAREDQWDHLIKVPAQDPRMLLMYEDRTEENSIMIFKIIDINN